MKQFFLVCSIVFGMSMNFTGEAADVDPNNIYFVILAGGSGERLWPLSRQNTPKQLLAVGGEQTLLEQAIERVASLAPRNNIWISTTQKHEQKIQEHIGSQVGRILAEPGSRNTGPAILLSCFELYKENPNAIVVFLPADPFIPEKDTVKFVGFLEHAIDFVASHDDITLLGVRPTYPATGYGYIEFDQTSASQAPYSVKHFREKPSADVAQQYIQSNTMLWNIGMFCAKVSVFMEEFKQEAPEIYEGISQYCQGRMPYEQVKSDSIDYAVMEKSKRVSVLPVDFAWCDVGNIEVFLSIKEQYDIKSHDHITVNAKNNLIDVPNKLVALIGIDDVCIVETDQVLLITKRSEAEQVRAVVKQLKQGARKEYL